MEGNTQVRVFVTHQINEAVYLADQVLVFSSRPGSIRDVVHVDLRPRPLAIKRSAKFLEYEDRIWAMIESEARQTMQEEVSS